MMSRDTVPGRSASMCVVRKRTVGPFTLHLGGEEKGAELILMLNKRTKKQKKGIAWHGMACRGQEKKKEVQKTGLGQARSDREGSGGKGGKGGQQHYNRDYNPSTSHTSGTGPAPA